MRSAVSLRQLCASCAAAMLLPVAVLQTRLPWPCAALGSIAAVLIYFGIDHGWRSIGKLPRLLRPVTALTAVCLAALLSSQVGSLFPETSGLRWVGLAVLALAAVAAQKGLAAVVRCGAVLFAPLMLILGAVLLLAVPSARMEWATPTLRIGQTVEALGISLLPLLSAALLPQVKACNAKTAHWALGMGAFGTCGAAVTSACLSPSLAAQPMAYYTLARSISAFGVMLRLEAFLSGALTAAAFTGIALLLCVAQAALPGEKGRLQIPILAGICGVLSVLPLPI